MIRNIIFDFGGVIFDATIRNIYEALIEDPVEHERFMSTVFPGRFHSSWNTTSDTRGMLEKLARLHPQYTREIWACWEKRHLAVKGLVPGMKDLVFELSAGYCLYGLTNWEGDTIDVLYELYPEVLEKLRGVVVSGKVGLRKPDPRIFALTLGTFGLIPEETLFIDNQEDNTYAARVQGMESITFRGSDHLRAELLARGIL